MYTQHPEYLKKKSLQNVQFSLTQFKLGNFVIVVVFVVIVSALLLLLQCFCIIFSSFVHFLLVVVSFGLAFGLCSNALYIPYTCTAIERLSAHVCIVRTQKYSIEKCLKSKEYHRVPLHGIDLIMSTNTKHTHTHTLSYRI